MTSKTEYVIDKNTGEIFEHRTTINRIHVAGSSLIASIESINILKVSDETLIAFKFKGGKLESRWSIHIPNTIQIRHPLVLEDDGEHLHASDTNGLYDIILDRALLLRNFDVVDTNTGDSYRCKPFFMVKESNSFSNQLSDSELDRTSYFYYVGVTDEGKCRLFIPPLSNVYDDGRMCNGSTVMRSKTPKQFKAEQLREHFELSMSNSDLQSGSLTRYARWDINERHSPLDNIRVKPVSIPHVDIVQSIVDDIRGRKI